MGFGLSLTDPFSRTTDPNLWPLSDGITVGEGRTIYGMVNTVVRT